MPSLTNIHLSEPLRPVVDWEALANISPIERAVVFLLAFTGAPYSEQSLAQLLAVRFRNPSAATVAGVIARLRQRRLPLGEPTRSAHGRLVFWQGKLTVACAQELVREADASLGWPTPVQLAKADYVDGQSHLSSYLRRLDPEVGKFMAAVLGFMRLFILGTRVDVPEAVTAVSRQSLTPVCRAAAAHLVRLLDGTPTFEPRVLHPLRDGLFLPWLNCAFLALVDVRPVLTALADELRRSGKMSEDLRHAYAALCVWTGWKEGLDACTAKDDFVEGCRLLLAGAFAQADAVLRQVWEKNKYRRQESLDNLPERFACLIACLAGKPGKMRPAQILRGNFYGDPLMRSNGGEVAYRGVVMDICRGWEDSWKHIWDGQSTLLNAMSEDESRPLILLLAAFCYQRLIIGRADYAAKARRICGQIPVALARGYVNLAGLFLSLMTGAYSDEQVQAAIDAVTERGVWFFPRVEPEPEWKSLVGILRGEVAKAQKVSQKAVDAKVTRRLVWKIDIKEYKTKPGVAEVKDITPVLEVENGGTRRRRALSLESLEGRGAADLRTTEDRLLCKILSSDSDDYYYDSYRITREAIEQLCGMTNLELDRDEEDRDWRDMDADFVPTSITFEKASCSFESTVCEDGGIALAVPGWLQESNGEYAVRKIEAGRYAFVSVPIEIAHLVSVFKNYGNRGRIEIPQEGLDEAKDVLDSIGELVPFANPSGDTTEQLPRVPGACACSVRLDFADGVFTVRAVVRPLSGNAALVVEPGLGLAEKLVTGAAGSYWLVRDLDAERLNFQSIHTALAAAEDWFDGRATWQIDDIPTALDALARLKALDPAVPLEWTDTRRLNVVNAPKHGAQLQSQRTAEEWFSVKGSFTLDDGRIVSVLDLLAAMSTREGRYVQLSDGDFVALTKSMAKELDALAAVGRRKGGALEVSRAALPMLDDVFDGSDDESLALPDVMAASAEEIRAALHRRPKVPNALQATLRSYQTEGYTWLSRLAACGFGSCLADDMGLGKTVQVIALLLERAADGVSLVVAPSSVCGNWRNEIRRFAPSLNPILALECADERLGELKPGDVLISSYGYLLFHETAFAGVAWNGVVLDEAQAIKNDASKRAHLVKRLRARFRVAATGTPVENHLGELWSLFDFLNPGLLGPVTAFASRFVHDGKAVPALKKIVKPLILRRLKGDVLDDLPEKTEVTIPVALGKEERSAYEACRLHALAALADKDSEADRFSILAELTRLRRFCCHPSLVLGADAGIPSAKMEALVELLESLHQGQHKALVFSQFTDYLKLVQQVVAAHGWSSKYLDGSTPTKERERLVNEFQTGESEFFLISLKAGGTGLNLTAANYVILLDPWWNPAVENQAADRAHRIGQKQPVTVYRLVADDTVEERVIELHKEKTAMAADLLEGTAKTSFSPADLIKLFSK